MLNPFLNVLRSSDPITIPRDTLQGALGHFFSTLSGDRFDSFVQDVLNSTSLWDTLDSHQIEAAVRPAAKVKIEALRPVVKDGWIFRNQLDKAAQGWLSDVIKAIKRVPPTGTHLLVLLIGILQGLDDVLDINWGRSRVDLEEEIVIALGELLDGNSCDLLDLYCSSADHIDPARLRALDLRVSIEPLQLLTLQLIVPRLHVALMTALGFNSTTTKSPQLNMDEITALSRGLARSFTALSDGGEVSQEYAWEELTAFARRMCYDCVAKIQNDWLSRGSPPPKGGALWELEKAALFAFLTVTWPAVQVMLDPEGHSTRKTSAELSSVIVITLAKFATLTEADSEMEGYERVLYGSLDILAADGGSRGVKNIFKELQKEPKTDSLAGFILIVADQLIRLLDAGTIRDYVLPLAHRSVPASASFTLTLLGTLFARNTARALKLRTLSFSLCSRCRPSRCSAIQARGRSSRLSYRFVLTAFCGRLETAASRPTSSRTHTLPSCAPPLASTPTSFTTACGGSRPPTSKPTSTSRRPTVCASPSPPSSPRLR